MIHQLIGGITVLLVLCLVVSGCGDNETDVTDIYEGDYPGECSNGADDDRDGQYDCDDDDCTRAPVCQSSDVDLGIEQNGRIDDSGIDADRDAADDDIDGQTETAGNGGSPGDPGTGGDDDIGDGTDEDLCLTDEDFLAQEVWPQVLAARCAGCHQEEGLAQSTRLVLQTESTPGWRSHNLIQIRQVITATDGSIPLLLLKPTGQHQDGHVGGQLIIEGSAEYRRIAELVGRITGDIDECGVTAGDPINNEESCDSLAPGRRLLRRLSHVEYQNTIRDLLGVQIDAKGAFVADTVDHGFENHPERLDVTGLLAEQYREMAESIADTVNIESIVPCTIAEGDINCAHRFIGAFGKRAYRRPLKSDEIAAYRNLYRLVVEQACFEDGIRWVVIGMLQSPHFLYRSELGRKVEDEFLLTPYEIASELSYLLWQTMPDETLFETAADGTLLNPNTVAAQVRRLLEDPKSTAMVNDFVGHWLELDGLMQVVRDAEIYAALYFELREAMHKETALFVGGLWNDNAPLADLFTTRSSWINEELAAYYEIESGSGPANSDGFRQVDVSATRPAGILTQGAFLTTHALPTSSSPIHRGVLVRERLLCNELQPPPEGLVIVPPPFDPTLTTRERFSTHSADTQCEGCHRLIDPIGLGFENYDGIGRYRDMEGDTPIDASGSVIRLAGQDTGFDGVGALAQILSDDDEVYACYTRQWLRFGFGETEGLDDECYVEALHQALRGSDGRMRAVVAALTQTPHFFKRRGEVGEADAPGVSLVPTDPNRPPADNDPAEPPDNLTNPRCGTPPPISNNAGIEDPRLTVDIRDDRWSAGYCQYVSITNASTATIDGWSVQIPIEGTLSSAWNVAYDREMGDVIFSNLDWNSVLIAGDQVEFGFCGTL